MFFFIFFVFFIFDFFIPIYSIIKLVNEVLEIVSFFILGSLLFELFGVFQLLNAVVFILSVAINDLVKHQPWILKNTFLWFLWLLFVFSCLFTFISWLRWRFVCWSIWNLNWKRDQGLLSINKVSNAKFGPAILVLGIVYYLWFCCRFLFLEHIFHLNLALEDCLLIIKLIFKIFRLEVFISLHFLNDFVASFHRHLSGLIVKNVSGNARNISYTIIHDSHDLKWYLTLVIFELEWNHQPFGLCKLQRWHARCVLLLLLAQCLLLGIQKSWILKLVPLILLNSFKFILKEILTRHRIWHFYGILAITFLRFALWSSRHAWIFIEKHLTQQTCWLGLWHLVTVPDSQSILIKIALLVVFLWKLNIRRDWQLDPVWVKVRIVLSTVHWSSRPDLVFAHLFIAYEMTAFCTAFIPHIKIIGQLWSKWVSLGILSRELEDSISVSIYVVNNSTVPLPSSGARCIGWFLVGFWIVQKVIWVCTFCSTLVS